MRDRFLKVSIHCCFNLFQTILDTNTFSPKNLQYYISSNRTFTYIDNLEYFFRQFLLKFNNFLEPYYQNNFSSFERNLLFFVC